ncbi:MAG TPA: pilus assembly protein TadG-related protein [Actinocrinis sp.]|nr:pilus assembly protein TadG-related protein [Actinocrinis sp.]
MRALIRSRPGGDGGSFTVAVVVWVLIFMALLVLIIDGSMEITANERAADVADSVARSVANDIILTGLTQTGAVMINSNPDGTCRVQDTDAIRLSLDDPNVSIASCNVKNGNTVTVTVALAYSPLLWGKGVTAHATATAAAVTAPTK